MRKVKLTSAIPNPSSSVEPSTFPCDLSAERRIESRFLTIFAYFISSWKYANQISDRFHCWKLNTRRTGNSYLDYCHSYAALLAKYFSQLSCFASKVLSDDEFGIQQGVKERTFLLCSKLAACNHSPAHSPWYLSALVNTRDTRRSLPVSWQYRTKTCHRRKLHACSLTARARTPLVNLYICTSDCLLFSFYERSLHSAR